MILCIYKWRIVDLYLKRIKSQPGVKFINYYTVWGVAFWLWLHLFEENVNDSSINYNRHVPPKGTSHHSIINAWHLIVSFLLRLSIIRTHFCDKNMRQMLISGTFGHVLTSTGCKKNRADKESLYLEKYNYGWSAWLIYHSIGNGWNFLIVCCFYCPVQVTTRSPGQVLASHDQKRWCKKVDKTFISSFGVMN